MSRFVRMSNIACLFMRVVLWFVCSVAAMKRAPGPSVTHMAVHAARHSRCRPFAALPLDCSPDVHCHGRSRTLGSPVEVPVVFRSVKASNRFDGPAAWTMQWVLFGHAFIMPMTGGVARTFVMKSCEIVLLQCTNNGR